MATRVAGSEEWLPVHFLFVCVKVVARPAIDRLMLIGSMNRTEQNRTQISSSPLLNANLKEVSAEAFIDWCTKRIFLIFILHTLTLTDDYVFFVGLDSCFIN